MVSIEFSSMMSIIQMKETDSSLVSKTNVFCSTTPPAPQHNHHDFEDQPSTKPNPSTEDIITSQLNLTNHEQLNEIVDDLAKCQVTLDPHFI